MWISSVDLAEKLDVYENVRCSIKKSIPPLDQKKSLSPKNPFQERKPYHHRNEKFKQEEQPEVVCYKCGTLGVIKPKYPNCKGKKQKNVWKF